MEPHAFDRFARACAADGTRRRLVALLAALPIAGRLTAWSGDAAAAAGGKLGGEPCNENRDCQTDMCASRFGEQRCACSNALSVGCADPAQRCWDDRFEQGLCIQPDLGGSPCNAGIECQSNTCREDRCSCVDGPNGIPCADRAQRCLNDRCVTPKVGGEPCQADRECQTSACRDTGVCSCANGDEAVPCVELANPCLKQVCVAQECRRQKRDDGAACPSVGNSCVKDVCINGQCAHRFKSDGAACGEDGNPCTDDICVTGQCTHPSKPDGANCGGGRGTCRSGTCRCDTPGLQVCPGKHGPCKLPLGQACTRDEQCCPEQTCCRGQCRLRSGEGRCRTDDDCCVTPTGAGPICCGGTCCYTCQGCNDITNTCIGASHNTC